jgi:tetratricopeptide (TPR) repeat protein
VHPRIQRQVTRIPIPVLALGILLGGAWCAAGACPDADGAVAANSQLDTGFHQLYELRFTDARAQFAAWEKAQPNDAMGPMAEAASYLFEEFYTQGVLTSEFFLDDDRLFGNTPLKANPERRASFFGALDRAQKLALARLRDQPNDANALLALAISTGMRGDYASIVEKKQLESLGRIKDADVIATKLLAIDPSRADANLPIGAAQYIIGCLPAYKRFILWFGGIHGDRAAGMARLRVTAEKGHYLRPFAKLMLALAAMRENQKDLARDLMQQLAAEFPDNPLFAKELAKLKK